MVSPLFVSSLPFTTFLGGSPWIWKFIVSSFLGVRFEIPKVVIPGKEKNRSSIFTDKETLSLTSKKERKD